MPDRFNRFLTLPNLLSLSRMALVPYILYLFYQRRPECDRLGFILAIIAILTDIFDGYLARRLGQVSEWGKVLDPLSDKVCIVGAAVVAVGLKGYPVGAMVLIILRDVAILLGGLYIVNTKGLVMVSDLWGKLTALTLAGSILVYLINLEPLKSPLLYLAMVMILASSGHYLLRFRRAVRETPERP
jgi:CDP-diacylglycerol--glycerol-3-phosphate 3-phosphatidyltransferase